ncbi:MAG: acyl carrier protein [Trebonia sp.]
MTTHASAIQNELLSILSAAAGIPVSLAGESPDVSLAELGLDSLASMQLQAAVKERFDILIPDDSFDMSFSEITRYVVERLGEGA